MKKWYKEEYQFIKKPEAELLNNNLAILVEQLTVALAILEAGGGKWE